MEEVIRQSPIGLSNEKIKEIYNNNNGNIKKTLMEIWNIPLEIEKEKGKWDEIRETCDAYDNEMNRMISNIKNSIK